MGSIFMWTALFGVGSCAMRLMRLHNAVRAMNTGEVTAEEFVNDVGNLGLASVVEAHTLVQFLNQPSLVTLQQWDTAWNNKFGALMSCNPRGK